MIDDIDKQISDVYDTPAANARLKTKGKVGCCVVHCELKFHLPARVLQEELPLALDTEIMSTLLAMEKEDVLSGEAFDLVVSHNWVSLDSSDVFRQ